MVRTPQYFKPSIGVITEKKIGTFQGGSKRLGKTHKPVVGGKVPTAPPWDTEPRRTQPINYACGFRVPPGGPGPPRGQTMTVPTGGGKWGLTHQGRTSFTEQHCRELRSPSCPRHSAAPGFKPNLGDGSPLSPIFKTASFTTWSGGGAAGPGNRPIWGSFWSDPGRQRS